MFASYSINILKTSSNISIFHSEYVRYSMLFMILYGTLNKFQILIALNDYWHTITIDVMEINFKKL